MVRPAVMAGGAFVLILIVVAVWGYFFATPRFWGLFSKEFDECEPEEDNKIANADKHQLDKDKKCVLVKTCASGYIPNNSNTACMSTAPPPPPPPPPSPPPPPAAVTTPIVSEIRDADLTSYEPVDRWDGYADANKVEYAMQYAKIGDKWQVNKCIGGYIPFATADEKECKAIGAACDGTKPENTQTLGYTATGKCGSVACKNGYTLYDGNCVRGTNDNTDNRIPSTWATAGNKYFVESMGWRPSYVEIPADEIQTDRSCREMCSNIGVSKTGKEFRSLLPANWKGSVVSRTTPTSRFFNHSIEEIATNMKLWNDLTFDVFELYDKNPESTDDHHNGLTWAGWASGYADGVPDEFKSPDDDMRKKGLKRIYFEYVLPDETRMQEWIAHLATNSTCGCEATEDPRYLFN